MRSVTLTTLALCATMAIGSTAAFAMDTTASDCRAKGEQVRTALEANSSSSNYSSAMKERNTGRDLCMNSRYQMGVEHYAAALKLLGVSAS